MSELPRLSDTLEVHEIAELFFRAMKQERANHQRRCGSTRKAQLKENLELLDAQAWEEMCPFFGWGDSVQFWSRQSR